MPDRKGYNFDGCAPSLLYQATVVNGNIVFPGGASYKLLVLPAVPTMTPALLTKITALIKAGATVVGSPPQKSPSLVNYPACDAQLNALVKQVWGASGHAEHQATRTYGKGKVIWGGALETQLDNLYPDYDLTATILNSMGVKLDFETDAPLRYTHRVSSNWDAYFVANTSAGEVTANINLRVSKGTPQLWDPITGKVISLPQLKRQGATTNLSLQFAPHQSYFVVFAKDAQPAISKAKNKNYSAPKIINTLSGAWNVAFDPKWGGPKSINFDALTDWTKRPEDGIKHYSGTATYTKTFNMPVIKANGKYYIDLGNVKNLAQVKLNGKDLGILWTAPWRKEIPASLLKAKNTVEVEVVNLWLNRLIGDDSIPDDGFKNGRWPEWLLKGLPRPGKRYTFATHQFYNKNSPLSPSGLTGPVTIIEM
ncbi:glycosylhydrolase-like jelly roll fold domain-containing protein [Mucilaginibacter antarcticus]|uniref:glycosylhydrolase-like jelly roll fold domain-containing protein n=1 Tax=Mucilaginibacter antarcticus TaxID=1855725 RepID=UPI0036331E3A